MWIFTKYGFFSVVCAHNGNQNNPVENLLMIRARSMTHLKALQSEFAELQDFDISANNGTDYKYRIVAPKEVVVSVFSQTMKNLDYSNFKKEAAKTNDRLYIDRLNEVWGIMLGLQTEKELWHKKN